LAAKATNALTRVKFGTIQGAKDPGYTRELLQNVNSFTLNFNPQECKPSWVQGWGAGLGYDIPKTVVTLTFDRVMLHTAMHHSSTSTYRQTKFH